MEKETPTDVLEEQRKALEENHEPTVEEELSEQIVVLSDSLIQAVGKCEDARQFAAVARLALNTGQPGMALSLLDVLIERIDTILGGYYDNMSDEDFVDLVKEKMKEPKTVYDTTSE